MSNHVNQQKKQSNPILWFVFAIVIPLIITLILTYTILLLVGVDVNKWLKDTGQKIPVISSMITTDEALDLETVEQKYNDLKQQRNEEVETLTNEIQNYEGMINRLESEIAELEAQIEFLKENQQSDAPLSVAEEDMVKKLSASFNTMKPKQAALIFSDLETKVAIQILYTLPNDVRGKILESMEPSLAASFTEKMISDP